MPITITITDPTPEQIAALFGVGPQTARIVHETVTEPVAPKPVRAKKPATPDGGMPLPTPERTPEEAELAAEIARDIADAPAEPKGATAVVDAGTGKPMEQALNEPVELTMDMVRANATRLAQADAPKLKAILGEFGAGKLSEVPADSLPDFAARVLEALG